MPPAPARGVALGASVALLALGISGAGRAEADALAMMAAVFTGDPTRAAIRAELDAALLSFSLAPGEEMYHRAGSVLVALRKATGVGEMAILRCVNGTALGGAVAFADAAAFCATLLEERRERVAPPIDGLGPERAP